MPDPYIVQPKRIFLYEVTNKATESIRYYKITAATFRGAVLMLRKHDKLPRCVKKWEHEDKAAWAVVNSSVTIFARGWLPKDEGLTFTELWDGHNETNRRNIGI
jgi:hypothetical protein